MLYTSVRTIGMHSTHHAHRYGLRALGNSNGLRCSEWCRVYQSAGKHRQWVRKHGLSLYTFVHLGFNLKLPSAGFYGCGSLFYWGCEFILSGFHFEIWFVFLTSSRAGTVARWHSKGRLCLCFLRWWLFIHNHSPVAVLQVSHLHCYPEECGGPSSVSSSGRTCTKIFKRCPVSANTTDFQIVRVKPFWCSQSVGQL